MPTLCKQERLFEKRLLSMLFGKGKRFSCGNSENQIRVCFLSVSKTEVWPEDKSDSGYPCKLLVNAPKSRYKHAVTRNRIKRLLRESYRFYKPLFEALPLGENVLLLSLQFTGRNISLDIMRGLVEQVAQTLQNRLSRA